jgi:hypothetical protein
MIALGPCRLYQSLKADIGPLNSIAKEAETSLFTITDTSPAVY